MSVIELRDLFSFMAGFCVSVAALAGFVYKVYVVLLKAFSAAFKKHIDPIIASVTSQILNLAEKLEEVEVHHEERYRSLIGRCDDMQKEMVRMNKQVDEDGRRLDDQQEDVDDIKTRLAVQERLLEERSS